MVLGVGNAPTSRALQAHANLFQLTEDMVGVLGFAPR